MSPCTCSTCFLIRLLCTKNTKANSWCWKTVLAINPILILKKCMTWMSRSSPGSVLTSSVSRRIKPWYCGKGSNKNQTPLLLAAGKTVSSSELFDCAAVCAVRRGPPAHQRADGHWLLLPIVCAQRHPTWQTPRGDAVFSSVGGLEVYMRRSARVWSESNCTDCDKSHGIKWCWDEMIVLTALTAWGFITVCTEHEGVLHCFYHTLVPDVFRSGAPGCLSDNLSTITNINKDQSQNCERDLSSVCIPGGV